MSEELSTAVMESPVKQKQRQPAEKKKRKPAPRFNVVLWNDNDHTFEYVEMMMLEVFGFPIERGFLIAWKVDKAGRAICMTTSREHAELKVEQIHAYGADPLIPRCKGSMTATIEQVDD